jgi:hypothetical protein
MAEFMGLSAVPSSRSVQISADQSRSVQISPDQRIGVGVKNRVKWTFSLVVTPRDMRKSACMRGISLPSSNSCSKTCSG